VTIIPNGTQKKDFVASLLIFGVVSLLAFDESSIVCQIVVPRTPPMAPIDIVSTVLNFLTAFVSISSMN